MLSFINNSCPNCNACSSAIFDFSSFLLKTASFLCFVYLNFIMTFYVFFIQWQTWISSGLTVVPVSDSAWQTFCSSSSLEIDRGTRFTSIISLFIHWALLRAFLSRLMKRFRSKELQFFKTSNSKCKISYF